MTGRLIEAHEGLPEPAGMLKLPMITGLPSGYAYGVTRYADIILRDAFPKRLEDLVTVLDEFTIDMEELRSGGGNRATHTARFDGMLQTRGWGKRTITVSKMIDNLLIFAARGHEIDMFGPALHDGEYPGVAVEMEWNNKDPFFDRDLLNFMALHREGALAVGVIVTRGPRLQDRLSKLDKKYGASTTHWGKIVPRINLGGGGECPLLVIGIEPERIVGFPEG